jgi:hypothetical protein
MVCSKQEIYDLCKIEGFSDTLRMYNQIYSYRKQINNLEILLFEFEMFTDDEEMINDIRLQLKHFNRLLKRIKEHYMQRIQVLVDKNYSKEIIDKFYAICNETLYIEYSNEYANDENYIVNYEELQNTNKVKVKELREKAKKEFNEY